jgi:diaminohydroxyphosphoribosylaminopyrimidine deaminase/5-amino-6-(5-phosphoribosylamino)uracil reductase
MRGNDDLKFMRRCLDLAEKAGGMTYPNPVVGSVIVHDGLIIGEGYHLKAGSHHAEVNAINSVRDKKLLPASTLYVNLEPCSHFGTTPPCADLIISSGIKKVVIGTPDTSDKVSGRGIAKLREAGCIVFTGVLENESRWINRRFFTFVEEKRPYIILKWAQSADGFLDYIRDKSNERKPAWITGNAEKVLVHRWRAREQAILAGAGTVRADNPLLNVRDWAGKDPARVILSSSGLIDSESAVFGPGGENIVFTHNTSAQFANSFIVKLDIRRKSVPQIAEYLFNAGIQSLIIEGGADVLRQLISEDLWDEARIFYGMARFKDGIKAPVLNGKTISQVKYSRSSLDIILNKACRFTHRIDNFNKYFYF